MTTPPVRPTYRDIGLKRTVPLYYWFRGHTATQVQRDAMEETQYAIALPDAIRQFRAIPGAEAAIRFAVSKMNEISTKLGIVYECDISLKVRPDLDPKPITGGSWVVTSNGRHYQYEPVYVLPRFRSVALAHAAVAAEVLSDDLLDLLDLRRDGDRVVRGADYTLDAPAEKFDPYRAAEGTVQTKQPVIPLSNEQLALMHAAHQAHHEHTAWRLGLGPEPTQTVGAAHQALEATAISEEQHHFLRMKAFSGVRDVGWTDQEFEGILLRTDRFHHLWADAIEALDWGRARLFDNLHQAWHVALGCADPAFLLPVPVDGQSIREWPKLPVREALAVDG